MVSQKGYPVRYFDKLWRIIHGCFADYFNGDCPYCDVTRNGDSPWRKAMD